MPIGYARSLRGDQNPIYRKKRADPRECELVSSRWLASGERKRPAAAVVKAIAAAFLPRASAGGLELLTGLQSQRDLITLLVGAGSARRNFAARTDSIDTSTPAMLFFHVMSAPAEMERELIVEPHRAGLQRAARSRGEPHGRRRVMTEEVVGAAPPNAGERALPGSR